MDDYYSPYTTSNEYYPEVLIADERCFHLPYGDEDNDAEVHHLQRFNVSSLYTTVHVPKSQSVKDSIRRKRHDKKRKGLQLPLINFNSVNKELTVKNNSEVKNLVNHDFDEQGDKKACFIIDNETKNDPYSTNLKSANDDRNLLLTERNASNVRIQELLHNGNCKSHPVFCELDELRRDETGICTFFETARWLKFEEDVEEEGQRWSKPFVASLPLYFLFQLRECFNIRCAYCLDVNAENRADILNIVLKKMSSVDLIPMEKQDEIFSNMMSSVIHLHEVTKQLNGMPLFKRSISENLINSRKNSISKIEKPGSFANMTGILNGPTKQNAHFRKKIPLDAETSNVMIATMDFINEPVMGFVRLKKSVSLEDVTEVNVPTRFMIILLGSNSYSNELHEMGRCISTLMADDIFHEVAYKAVDKSDFLAGFDGFLDEVTVLPPTEWDPKTRIEPPKTVPDKDIRRESVKTGNFVRMLMSVDETADEKEELCMELQRTGKLFGGLINDIKRKKALYFSDFIDCLHLQCLGSIFFMYFACLTPIVAFGGLLGAATNNNIAVIESIFSGCICGVMYHLFSGQPLTILGSTGPILIYETITYKLCENWQWNYLSLRFWIGLWSSFLLLIVVAFDLSAYVRYITRFTEESFAVLIAAIFIIESFKNIYHIQYDYPVNYNANFENPPDYTCNCFSPNSSLNGSISTSVSPVQVINSTLAVPINYSTLDYYQCEKHNGFSVGPGCGAIIFKDNIYFFSILLFIGTFAVAIYLQHFKMSSFFPTKIRTIISDFSVIFAISIFCLVDYCMGLKTPKLIVPEKFHPTRNDREWVVYPFNGNPKWTAIAAICPALIATILIFMDQQITTVIINRKEHKLNKGGGYHLDLLIVSILISICSVIGLPWFVAATVLSINHVRSLSKESEVAAPGELPKFLGVREQRVTGIIVFSLIGLSVFMTPFLKYVPMPVLYGVFFFMGISSLFGVQLVQRISIFFMPKKYQPDYIYLRHVRLIKVHLFTIIQLICLGLLWLVKKMPQTSIIFPVLVLAMCFVRAVMNKVFTQNELKWLDDIMPESHREKQANCTTTTLEFEGENDAIAVSGGTVNFKLPDGRNVNIPLGTIHFNRKTNQLNISEEIKSKIDELEDLTNDVQGSIKSTVLSEPKNLQNEYLKNNKIKSNNVKFYITDIDEVNEGETLF